MLRKNDSSQENNFWISYADLMAGLLFVFILLIGAIVSKSIILKSNLIEKEDKLTQISQTLQDRELTLQNAQADIANKKMLISTNKKVLEDKKRDIAKKREDIAKKKRDLEEKNRLILAKNDDLSKNKKSLAFKSEEIKKLNKLLLEANTQKDILSNKVVVIQNILTDTKKTMKRDSKELSRQIDDYKGKVLVLSDQLTDINKTVANRDKKLLKLLNTLDDKETKYDDLIAKLQSQKAKIKSLTGLKLKVVAALKDELGDKVAIDKKSGSLRVSSNILFDKGSAKLKKGAKVELKQVFEEYIGALVTNNKIKPHLDKIIIEGHTDSDGSYLYNLDLSQKRAFVVMNYLLSLDFAKKNNSPPLLIASGRAYLDHIYVNGVEDKDASRRIEVKFRLKNEDAMHEIEKVLDAE